MNHYAVYNRIPAGSDWNVLFVNKTPGRISAQTSQPTWLPNIAVCWGRLSHQSGVYTQDAQHIQQQNTVQEKRGQNGRGRGDRQLVRNGKQARFEGGIFRREREQSTLSNTFWTPKKCVYVYYLWWVLCVTPWPVAPQTRWAGAPRRPKPTSTAGSHPPASGPSAPGRRCGRSPPYCWPLTRCHLRKHGELVRGVRITLWLRVASVVMSNIIIHQFWEYTQQKGVRGVDLSAHVPSHWLPLWALEQGT